MKISLLLLAVLLILSMACKDPVNIKDKDAGKDVIQSISKTSTCTSENAVLILAQKYQKKGLTKLTKTELPPCTTEIGDCAFAENELTEVTIPESVTTIGTHAFRDNKFTEITIPKSVTPIDDFSFRSSLLKTVTLSPALYNSLKDEKRLSTVFSESVTQYKDHDGNSLL